MLSLANAPKTTFKVVFEDWEDKTGCQKDKTEIGKVQSENAMINVGHIVLHKMCEMKIYSNW